MYFTRTFPGVSTERVGEIAEMFEADGAVVQQRENEGAVDLIVTYTDHLATSPTPTSGASANSATDSWRRLVSALKGWNLPGELKTACLSQWIIESGRGGSELAKKHHNFGGLKYRERMQDFATPVDYMASDGEGVYCKFASEADFIKGYWHFITSGPYGDWENYNNDGAGYIRHIAPKYAADGAYVEKVLNAFAEARALLGGSTPSGSGSDAGMQDSGGEIRLAIVVGHNSVSQGAYGISPINRSEFHFNNAVADAMVAEAAHHNMTAMRFNRKKSSSYTSEIENVYREASQWAPTCILELHFNSLNEKSTGTEMLFANGSSEGRKLALGLVAEVGNLLGLTIRHGDGLKPLKSGDRGYSSVVAAQAPTVLAEPFFGSNPNDCVKVASFGEAALGRAYLRAVRDWATASVQPN